MLYSTSEICHYPELSSYQELLYDDISIVKSCDLQVLSHNKVKIPSETFIEYAIITEEGNKTFRVNRRYSDFEWLMKYLYDKYPFQILPPMPPKRFISTVDKFSRPFIDQRQMALNVMLRRLRSFKNCLEDERTQIFLKHDQKEFDKYKSIHRNISIFTKFRRSIQQMSVGSFLHFGSSDALKDDNTVSYIKIMNKRAIDRARIMSILESLGLLAENWEDYSISLLLLAQDLSDIVLLMKRTELTAYFDGSAQLFFNLSSEGKLHFGFVQSTIEPIMTEYLHYNDHIIRTIKRRNKAQSAYYSKKRTLQLLDSKMSQSDIKEMPKGNEFDELTKQSILLEDNLNQFDEVFIPGLSTWQHQRSKDMARCLNVIVTSNLKFHRSCLDLCKHVLTKIQDDL